MTRLPPVNGEWIDRTRELAFTFEGRPHTGYAGDTISSALAANGARLLGRSFKYHRPRGILSFANHDSNTLMQVRLGTHSTPNVRADVTPLQDGMEVNAVNTAGGVLHDRRRFIDRWSRFLPVGFYYKAFHSRWLLPYWERLFREASGLGVVSWPADRVHTPKRYDHTDVLVIGGGPSGLAAALAAADEGQAVLLVEESARLGGSAHYARGGKQTDLRQIEALIGQVRTHARIRVLTSTWAAGYYADHWVPLITTDYLIKVRAGAVVFAQGAFELPAVFRNNDLPGCMLASGAQRLMYRHAVAPCRRVAILTANSHGYAAALDALAQDVKVAVVVDLRSAPGPASSSLRELLDHRGVRTLDGTAVHEAHAGDDGTLASLSLRPWSDGRTLGEHDERIEVDGLWMSVGYAPANGLLMQAGTRMRFETAIGQHVPAALPPGLFACGKLNGVYGLTSRLSDGVRAGQHAARYCGGMPHRYTPRPLGARELESPSHPYPVVAHAAGKNFVDFDEDLQVKDLLDAAQEGFDSIELLKRYSTVGMGPSQGKHAHMNAIRLLARVRGEPVERMGATTARPMFHPVPLAALAGRSFAPERATPLAAAHQALGAAWMSAGQWRRPEYYRIRASDGAQIDRATAIRSEVLAVRERAGLIDVSTLGKIEVHGPDAALFLERVYAGRYASLEIGRSRYGLMLDDAGVIVDDGVIARLDEQHYYFTTTTGNSTAIYRELGRLVTAWGLNVGLVNATGHYAAFNLAGPASRRILGTLTHLDLSATELPYLGVRTTVVADSPARLLRVGFVGELGYEIHIPADRAWHVWHALLAAGEPHGLRPFGVEAQRILRLEKGHIIVGQDTDGLTDPYTASCEWAVKMDKPFFVGQRSLRIISRRGPRQKLVGFTLATPPGEIPRECHLVVDGEQIGGRVTSVAYSPSLQRVIGLAMLNPVIAQRGTFAIRVADGSLLAAQVAATPFYDPTGERQRLTA